MADVITFPGASRAAAVPEVAQSEEVEAMLASCQDLMNNIRAGNVICLGIIVDCVGGEIARVICPENPTVGLLGAASMLQMDISNALQVVGATEETSG